MLTMKKGGDVMKTLPIIRLVAPASLVVSSAAYARSAKTIDVRIAAGETYVIDQLSRAEARIKVISNPNALVANGGMPGALMLVGAEAGCWKINVERANGEQVTYDVTVTSVGRPISDPLPPGKLPYLPDPHCDRF